MTKTNKEIIADLFDFDLTVVNSFDNPKSEQKYRVIAKTLYDNPKHFASSLLAKLNIPEEGEVVAEGEVEWHCISNCYDEHFNINDCIFDSNNLTSKGYEILRKHDGKKVQIIIREVK